MKYIFTILSALIISATSYGQINAYFVLSAGGTFTTATGKGSLSSTLGEMSIVQTFSAGGHIITQGFQQGNYIKSPSVSLPVKLLDFDGFNKGTYNHLIWQTASEINNQGFELERLNANAEFEKIGYVAGNGNSNALLDYQFDDMHPLQGDNYYRLKQIDFDGHFAYSDVVSIYSGTSIATDVSVYPMPVTDVLNVVIHNGEATIGAMTITNIVGETVYESPAEIYEGTTVKKIDLSSYAPGQYFVKLTTGSNTKTIHIVRQ
ncbi:MAG: hypothetical protein JWO03_1488 [Bacteroidetes bacterium]|nr:hypothetical protein [Bacteroidota bacterium]